METTTRSALGRKARELASMEYGGLAIARAIAQNAAGEQRMVAAFLRGATNPPPSDWFYPCETWTAKCMQKGLTVTVPDAMWPSTT